MPADAAPRASILLPCRNAAAWLPEAIDSLRAQTFADFEVLAVDDVSADRTRALLDAWAAGDARVRVLDGAGRGIVAALGVAAGAARGELLARMDADDVAHPRRLELQVALLDADPSLAACGTGVRYFPSDVVADGARRYARWLNALHTHAQIDRDLFVECPLAHPTLVVRRDAFRAVGGYRDAGWPEDYDLVLRLWAAGHRLANHPGTLLAWRERPDRASRTLPQYTLAAFRRCKAHWLAATRLRAGWEPGRPAGAGPLRRVVVWGAGPVGKAFALELQRLGCDVAAFVDLDPRKIGQVIHGAPVVEPRDADRWPDAFVVAAVGSDGARAEIRAALARLGRREPEDACAVA